MVLADKGEDSFMGHFVNTFCEGVLPPPLTDRDEKPAPTPQRSWSRSLLAAGMLTGTQIAAQLGVRRTTIGRWRCEGCLKARICNEMGQWLYAPGQQRPSDGRPPSEHPAPGAPDISRVGGAVRETILRGRRSPVPALRGPAPPRGRLPRWAEAARASGPAGAQRFPGRHRRPLIAAERQRHNFPLSDAGAAALHAPSLPPIASTAERPLDHGPCSPASAPSRPGSRPRPGPPGPLEIAAPPADHPAHAAGPHGPEVKVGPKTSASALGVPIRERRQSKLLRG